MPKKEILEHVREGRTALLAALEDLPPDAMLRPGVAGLWSIKDILAHLTAWQSELVTALTQLDKPTRVPNIVNIEDIDAWNDEQYRAAARRSVQAVLEDFNGVHKHLLKAVESLDDKTLDDARKFPWMEGEPLWYLIEENVTLHEREHAAEIRAWRENMPT